VREEEAVGLIVRVLFGFIAACLAAGLTTGLFVHTPGELAGALTGDPASAAGDPWSQLGFTILVVVTQSAIFAAPFALVAASIGEWNRARDWTYYAMVGIVIALLGFTAQWLSEETGQGWSVVNSNYPLITFLTTGFAAGWVYWACAGRKAGMTSEAPPATGPAEPASKMGPSAQP
jgi:hypothetical protein